MADILVQARVELAEAVEWYDAREDGLGGRLLAEARETVARSMLLLRRQRPGS